MLKSNYFDKNGKEVCEGDTVKAVRFCGDKAYYTLTGRVMLGEFETAGDGQGFGNNIVLGWYISGQIMRLGEVDDCSNCCLSLIDWEEVEIIDTV